MTQKLKALTNHFKGLASSSTRRSGSILAYTLIVLTIMLMTALSVASVTILDKKNAATTAGSTQAFNNADSGAEMILGYRYRDDTTELDSIVNSTCNPDGTVTLNNVNNGTATITFYSDPDGTTPLACNDASNPTLAQIQKVKSVGSFSGSSRAIEVAVADGSGCAWISIGQDCGGSYCQGGSPDIGHYASGLPTDNELCRIKHNDGYSLSFITRMITNGSMKSFRNPSSPWGGPFNCSMAFPCVIIEYLFCCSWKN